MKHNAYLPWIPLMEIAFGMLGIAPDVFWDMTPSEWLCAFRGWQRKYGIRDIATPDISRRDLEDLMSLFPD